MKKVVIFLLFLVALGKSFSQSISKRSSISITVMDARVKDSLNLIIPTYTDTTSNEGGAMFSNNIGLDSCGALIYTYSDNSVWIRQCLSGGKRWGLVGGFNGTDTIYVRFPLGVDTVNAHQVIFIRTSNGLVSGGVVTKSGCWSLSVTPAIYNLNYSQFTSLLTTVNIDTADATMPRIDYVIVDTFDVVSVLTGTPSATPLPPYVNPSSQLILTRIDVPAGASCLDDISVTTVYDQNVGVPTEFAPTSSGTITVDFNNTDNPKHLTKAAFVSTYTDGSKLIFTHTALRDTVALNEVFLFWLYLNGNFTNQLQAQFWMNDTAVSNNLVLNPFFNPLDSNEYQNVTLPFSSFVFSSPYFNKLVITHAGYDTSGAKGYYADWIQFQKGINNSSNSKVDSVTNIAGNLYYWINGIATFISSAGGGSADRFGIEDNTGVQDRTVNFGNLYSLNLTNTKGFYASEGDDDGSTGIVPYLYLSNSGYGMAVNNNTNGKNTYIAGFSDSLEFQAGGTNMAESFLHIDTTSISFKFYKNYLGTGPLTGNRYIFPPSASITADVVNTHIIPITVNNTAPDNTGNITISTGSGTVTNVSSANANATVANPTTTPVITIVSAPKWLTGRTLSITGDLAYTSPSFDGSGNVTAAGTLATVNPNVGTFGSATQVAQITANAKGLTTAVSNVTITPAASSITGGAALSKTDDTNVTLTLGGTPSTALLAATSMTLGWTGQLSVPRGGTGLASATAFAVLTGGTTSTGAFQSVSGVGTSGQALISNGAAALPTWQDVAVTNAASQKIQATAEQTAFTFSGVPSSYNNFAILINGDYIDQSLYYTKSGNVITFSSGVQLGAYVSLVFK